ncbi:hypothetical protein E6H24_05745 [Candidatus Bathyarchaeota archaeon]|nr:MAG: hypothetical protein E6H24_05745 [Candidatus Bathyarchaeota archaeon]
MLSNSSLSCRLSAFCSRITFGKTMESLRLERTFQARLLENSPSNLGMLWSVKALVAWGEVEPEVLGRALAKRGERDGADGLDEGFVKLLGTTKIHKLVIERGEQYDSWYSESAMKHRLCEGVA